ncbi:MAG: type II secretion system protein, partial [Patescibacteria group bacterium]|nr:type II secretion system protein [Patescibacteria group bacterium]
MTKNHPVFHIPNIDSSSASRRTQNDSKRYRHPERSVSSALASYGRPREGSSRSSFTLRLASLAQGKPPKVNERSSFTLIELLIVIAIIGILASVVVLVLNPAQLLSQSRDSRRTQDLSNLNNALSSYLGDGNSGLGSSNIVYVSIPDPTLATGATSTCSSLGLPTLPADWSYQCVSTTTLRNSNGTGWIPVDFQSVSFGTPIPELPIDPVNST